MRIPQNENFAVYDRDKHPVAIRAAGVAKQIENAENEIDACFKIITP
jgi:hypothetical protein